MDISSKHREFLAPYQLVVGDTLYFESNHSEVDTCVVISIDSFQMEGSFSNVPYKEMHVNIIHLPQHHWEGQGIHPKAEQPQNIVSISKSLGEYKNHFCYRDFSANMDSLVPPKKDTLLQQLGIEEYWVLKDDWNRAEDSIASVETIIWTRELGLTAYYKKDGSYYIIKNRQ